MAQVKGELTHEVLRLLDRLSYQPSLRALSLHAGRHDSRRVGSSTEFREFREFRKEDGLKAIDWKASARSQRKLVREKEHQGRFDHWMLVDSSGSMLYPDGPTSKFRRQLLICGALMYLFNGQGDRIAACSSQEGQPVKMEPSRGSRALDERIGWLADLQPSGQTITPDLIQNLSKTLRGTGVVWAFTDLDGEPEPLLQAFSNFGHMGFEVNVIHLYHPHEKDLPFSGPFVMEDLESWRSDVDLNPENLSDAYRELWIKEREDFRSRIETQGHRFHSLDITESPESWITSIFSRKSRG